VVKKAIYEKNRVAEYWIADPYMKSITVLAPNEKGAYELFAHGALAEDTVEQKKEVASKLLAGLTVKLKKVFD